MHRETHAYAARTLPPMCTVSGRNVDNDGNAEHAQREKNGSRRHTSGNDGLLEMETGDIAEALHSPLRYRQRIVETDNSRHDSENVYSLHQCFRKL